MSTAAITMRKPSRTALEVGWHSKGRLENWRCVSSGDYGSLLNATFFIGSWMAGPTGYAIAQKAKSTLNMPEGFVSSYFKSSSQCGFLVNLAQMNGVNMF